jgi:hypothetical protein
MGVLARSSRCLVLTALAGLAATGCTERARQACRDVEASDVAAWTTYAAGARTFAESARGAVEATDAGPPRLDELQRMIRAMNVLSGGQLAPQATIDGMAAATRAMGVLESAARQEATQADAAARLAEKALVASREHDAAAAHASALSAAAPASALHDAHRATVRAAAAYAKAIQAIPFQGVTPMKAEDWASGYEDTSLPHDGALAIATATAAERWSKCQSAPP